jgi:AbrB family looped-hinge helix DNA binding protein
VVFLLLEWKVKMPSSRLSSKGQVTIPQAVRTRLGLRTGDRVDFVEDGDKIVLKPGRERTNPFEKYIGVLPGFRSVEEINAWVREMREDDRLPE